MSWNRDDPAGTGSLTNVNGGSLSLFYQRKIEIGTEDTDFTCHTKDENQNRFTKHFFQMMMGGS